MAFFGGVNFLYALKDKRENFPEITRPDFKNLNEMAIEPVGHVKRELKAPS